MAGWNRAVIKVAPCQRLEFRPADAFASDFAGAPGVLHAALAARTKINGVADSGDVKFSAVRANAPIRKLIVFQPSAFAGGADVAAGSAAFRADRHGNELPNCPTMAATSLLPWIPAIKNFKL